MLEIGEYVNDVRLVQRRENYASFLGEGCNPAVYVHPQDDGFYACQHHSDFVDKNARLLPPVVFASAPTAEGALCKIIGPVIVGTND